jgi:hypothetical protein
MKMRFSLVVLAGLVLFGLMVSTVWAQSSSSNYRIEESYIGPGGQIDSSSGSYQARASLGDTGVGYSSSVDYGLWAGYTTTTDPYIELVVAPVIRDLGVLSTSTAAYTTGSFYVRTYLASGYVVVTASDPPVNSNYHLTPLSSGGTSSPGTEQFGINLVANTTANGAPADYGTDPQQYPDSTFGFGYAAAGYDTDGTYRYNKGDVIAQSDSSSGRTDYTISYLYNISDITPGGLYTLNHVVVATSTY